MRGSFGESCVRLTIQSPSAALDCSRFGNRTCPFRQGAAASVKTIPAEAVVIVPVFSCDSGAVASRQKKPPCTYPESAWRQGNQPGSMMSQGAATASTKMFSTGPGRVAAVFLRRDEKEIGSGRVSAWGATEAGESAACIAAGMATETGRGRFGCGAGVIRRGVTLRRIAPRIR